MRGVGAPDGLHVSRETQAALSSFTELLQGEAQNQNLVSKTSLDAVWTRHIMDSAQLVLHAPPGAATWLDLGSGAGFPGLIVPLFHRAAVTLVESRRLRAEFLNRAADVLRVRHRVEIVCSRVENVPARRFAVISARAFAPLERLLHLAERFSTPDTVWVLPKGRSAKSELEAALRSWQGDFRLEPSLTDPEARIIVASAVRRRSRGR